MGLSPPPPAQSLGGQSSTNPPSQSYLVGQIIVESWLDYIDATECCLIRHKVYNLKIYF